MNPQIILPSEWFPQSGIQLTWPHADTDWAYMLNEVDACFVQIAEEIAKREKLLIVSPQPEQVKILLAQKIDLDQIRFFKCESNDTWARDHGGISIFSDGTPVLLDFSFNGWGLKFAANYDNLITGKCFESGVFDARYENRLDFVIEGGSIESDGEGTLLTTSECLLSRNRNAQWNRHEIETYLKQTLGLKQILWLDYGYLSGDDTDSHIDTLARLCPDHTIAYVQCRNPKDEHYNALQKMENQLREFRTLSGNPYRLLPLPMADPIYDEEGERLPATYANFLIINGAVLYPTYDQPLNDRKAADILECAFPGYEIVGIDCRALIRQHGSLHCVTMQYPMGIIQ